MSFQYFISPRAKLEALDIAVWYQKQAELGYTFLSELDNSYERIANNPKLYQVQFKDVRWRALDRFPCKVFFRIDENTIVILSVQHHRRNPNSQPGFVDEPLDA